MFAHLDRFALTASGKLKRKTEFQYEYTYSLFESPQDYFLWKNCLADPVIERPQMQFLNSSMKNK